MEGTLFASGIAEAMDAPSLESLTDPMQRTFRSFADQIGADLRALSACVKGSHIPFSRAQVQQLTMPVLIAAGTADPLAQQARELAAMFPDGTLLEIPGRDHNRAVGDKVHKQGVLDFLASRP